MEFPTIEQTLSLLLFTTAFILYQTGILQVHRYNAVRVPLDELQDSRPLFREKLLL